MSRTLVLLTAAALLGGGALRTGAEDKGHKPKLELRASPRFGFSPLDVLVTAELKGGDDVEQYHCPELEWDWDDGGKSTADADCDPFVAGKPIQRRFTASHEFKRAGTYEVSLTMRRADDAFAKSKVKVTVRAGLGDPTFD